MRSRRTTAPTRAIAKLRRSDPTASHQSGQEADAPATGVSQRDDTRWSWGVRALAAEVVFEADDVLELGRRNFDEGAAFDRLVPVGARRRDEQARRVAEEDLVAVVRVEPDRPLDGLPGEGFRRLLGEPFDEPLLHTGIELLLDVNVDPQVPRRSGDLVELRDDLRH